MAELADAQDSGSCFRLEGAGSSPVVRTNKRRLRSSFFVTATDLRQFFNCRQTMFATCTCAADTIGAYCATIAITLVSLATSPVIRTQKASKQ